MPRPRPCDPPHVAFDILHTEIINAYRRTGKDFNIGRRTAGCAGHGTSTGSVSAPPRVSPTLTTFAQTFVLTIAGLVRDVVIAGARITNKYEFDSYITSIARPPGRAGHLDVPTIDLASLGPSCHRRFVAQY